MRFTGSVRLRPVRIGLLVNPSDFSSIKRFLQLSACLWGGYYNPIIPVFSAKPPRWRSHQRITSAEITRGYIRFFEPDVLIESRSGQAHAAGWSASESFRDFRRTYSLDGLSSVDSYGRNQFAVGIDIIDVFAHRYRREFQFQLRHDREFVSITNIPKRNAFFEVMAGVYPEDENLSHIPDNYKAAFAPSELPFGPDTYMSLLQKHYIAPLWFTKEAIDEWYRDHSDLTFFVFDPTDGQDVIDAWNIRQFRQHIIPVNVDWIAHAEDYIRETIERNYRPLPGNPHGVMIRTTVEFGRSISEERATGLVEEHLSGLPRGSLAVKYWYDDIWSEHDDRLMSHPSKVRLTAGSNEIDAEVSEPNLNVSYKALSPDFANAAKGFRRASWVNVVRPGGFVEDDRLATVYPTNLFDPKFPRLGLGTDASVTREGWTFPERYKDHRGYLELQYGRDALIEWFGLQGITATPSEAGRVAEQVIAAVGDLFSCAMFADERTLRLLNDMAENATQRKKKADGTLVETRTAARAVPTARWEENFRESRGRMPWITLERFVDASILKAGLELKCPHCAYYNWVDIGTLDYDLTCDRCLKSFKFPQTHSALKKETRWLYRAIGPFATPGFAQGGYAVALTLRLFGDRLTSMDAQMTWSTGLALSGAGLESEIDFAFWCQRERSFREHDEPIFVVGEAKSYAHKAFKSDDIARLKAVADRFPGAYVVASTLKNELSESDRKLLTNLARWGRRRRINGSPRNPVIILTGLELLATFGSVETAWKKAGGKAAELVEPAYVNLAHPLTLAELTQRLHLNLPDFYEDLKSRRRRARAAG